MSPANRTAAKIGAILEVVGLPGDEGTGSMDDASRLEESLKQVRIVAEHRPDVEGDVERAERAIREIKATVTNAQTDE